MRRLVIALTCVVALSAQAQVPGMPTQMLMPSPLGLVLMVGKWIWDSNTRQEVYYIEVAGDGATTEQARNNGFRLAVEQALGTLIASESQAVNGQLVRDEIISYASGFVEKFEIIAQQPTNNGQRVSMRVWVRKSSLSDRLLNRSQQAGKIDGARASIQLQTLNQERETGDRLLQTVLNDFPRRAFDIKLDPVDVIRQNRTAQIEVNYTLGWNQDYLRSLWTALKATAYQGRNAVSIIGIHNGGWFRDFGGEVGYDDSQKYALLVNRMVSTMPSLLVTVRSGGRDPLFSACFAMQELDHSPKYVVTNQRFVQINSYGPYAYLDGRLKLKGLVKIPVSPHLLQQATDLEMTIVTRDQCPNR